PDPPHLPYTTLFRSREYVRQEKAGADKMELEKFTLGSLRRAVFDGDTDTGSLMAGQVAGMLHDIRPVAEILAGLMDGCKARLGEDRKSTRLNSSHVS